MSIINTIKNILALNDDITEKRIGLSSFKPMTKTIENAKIEKEYIHYFYKIRDYLFFQQYHIINSYKGL